jgi:transposase-like protein
MEKLQNHMETEYRERLHEQAEQKFPDQDFKALNCPNCGSRNVRTTITKRITSETRWRHHKCGVCPATFNSLETIPLIDRDQT